MTITDQFGILVFLCIFEILGGAGLGVGLRNVLRRSPDPTGCFFLIWGAGFAGIPLLMGALTFLPSDKPVYFVAQAFVFLTAVLVAALTPETLFQDSKDGSLFGLAVAGGVMALIGGAVVLVTWKEGINLGLLVGWFFGLLGTLFLFGAARQALQGLR